MRVALTGASGFTGRFVAEALAAAGFDWVALDADLGDPAAVERAVAETAFDTLIHLAARAFVDQSDWKAFYAVNQIGTLHLLDAVSRARPGARCLIASSAQVYGPGAEGLVTEDSSPNPANHYAVSKWAMELGAARWRDRLEIVSARPFNYTGVGQGTQYLVPKIVDHFRRRAPVIELGNTWVKRDFGDVRAVADAYVGLVAAAAVPPAVNIATGALWSISDLLTTMEGISGHRVEVRVNSAFVRTNDVPVLGGDTRLLSDTLPDWRPRAMEDTLAWMYRAG